MTNPCNNLDKSIYQFWQIHVKLKRNPPNNFDKSKLLCSILNHKHLNGAVHPHLLLGAKETHFAATQSRFPSTVVWHFVLLSSKQIMLLLDEVWSQLIEKQEPFGERGVTFFWGHYGWALLYHCTVNKKILHWIIWLIQHL